MKKRMLWFGIIFTIMIMGYVFKLYILQMNVSPANLFQMNDKYKQSNWRKNAVNQRSKQLVLNDGRAIFLDSHHHPLQSESYDTVVFFPIHQQHIIDENFYSTLANILEYPKDKLKAWLIKLEQPSYLLDAENLPIKLNQKQKAKLEAFQQLGLIVVEYTARIGHEGKYRHIIGFLGEHPEWVELRYQSEIEKLKSWDKNMKIGVNGLEHSLDRVMHGIGASYISYPVDGKDRMLSGIGPRLINTSNPYYPLQVITTIDEQLQIATEEILKAEKIEEGAIVLLDTNNGDIKAMISYPELTPTEWQAIDNDSWRNHALTAYEPGSIYKIITAAAAIEFGLVKEEERFHCNGEYGKYGLSCWKKGGHGHQTLAEAFANSCNVVFATIAERLTSQQLYDTALALGVVQKVGWHSDEVMSMFQGPLRLLEEEEQGTSLLNVEVNDGGILAQSGIGQRDVRITPLQAANMLVTIINRGKQFETRAVSRIEYADGVLAAELPVHLGHEHKYQIHPQTAHMLMGYLKRVVSEGTASYIFENDGWSLAGKTGTAQLSGALAGYNNQWFIGYAPAEQPRYAAAVLIRKAKQGTKNRAPIIFQKVMKIAEAHDQLVNK